MYATTRKHYPPSQELTIGYGQKYRRDYPSHKHRAVSRRTARRATSSAPRPARRALALAPGWFNPKLQPVRRPAFRLAPKTDEIVVCPDDAEVVRARKLALGVTDVPTAAAAAARPPRRRAPPPPPRPPPRRWRRRSRRRRPPRPPRPPPRRPRQIWRRPSRPPPEGRARRASQRGARLLSAFPATKKARGRVSVRA